MNQYPAEVVEIHSAFNNASTEILKQANESVITKQPKNSLKVELLRRLGFSKANEVQEYEIVENEYNLSKKLIDKIHQYKVQYPNNKFITQEQVNTICKNWGLVHGTVDRYKGFVPEKNLKEIEKFTERYVPKGAIFLDNMVIEGYEIRLDGSHYRLFKVGTNNKYILQSANGTEFYGALDNVKALEYHSELINKIRSEASSETIRREGGFVMDLQVRTSPFQICAPLKDMDTEGLRLIGNKLVHIPDPVVLYPVELGFIIVSAWGDEASDENVVNQNFN